MQSDRKRTPRDLPYKEEVARRTTIIFDKDEREYIDALIREGKEPGIKPLISKMLDIHRNMMVYDWRFPGEYYCGISRIAFVNIELLNILIQHTPKEKRRDIGKTMGAALKVSMETTLDLPAITRDSWEKVFKRSKYKDLATSTGKTSFFLLKHRSSLNLKFSQVF